MHHLRARARSILAAGAALAVLAAPAAAQRAAGARRAAQFSNPVVAGDYPDPSVIRVGRDYWATATSSEWGPPLPILHSKDLVNWRVVGTAFRERPAWSDGNYWAPEITRLGGRYLIYYVGHKKGGSLCVAVASAPTPAGPYTDHGPLVCQDAGSIDGFMVEGEDGKPYLLWKEDGNSRNLPTPIWAQRLSDDGLKLVGDRKELIRNDAPWEAQLVEGPAVVRRNGYFYMFYAGAACCGRECNYKTGVARAKSILGPWEKDPANPILVGNEYWKCPGHGTVVQDPQGRDFFMYHAYHPADTVYVGRQALLDRVEWGADGWPTINGGRGPSATAAIPAAVPDRDAEYRFSDDFTSPALGPGWQWPHAAVPSAAPRGGRLVIAPPADRASDPIGAIVARSTTVGDYVATTALDTRRLRAGASAGLAVIGDRENAVGVSYSGGAVTLWRREKNQTTTVATADAPAGPMLQIRLTAVEGHRFRFAVSGDGRRWADVGGEVSGAYLPPWDRGLRVALTAGGATAPGAAFDFLRITPSRRALAAGRR